MSETRPYIVTDLAGPKVAGRRVEPGDTLELTENAARAELLAGVIVPAVETPPAEAAEPVDGADTKTVKKR